MLELAVYCCPLCEREIIEQLPAFTAGLDAWPKCCGYVCLLVKPLGVLLKAKT